MAAEPERPAAMARPSAPSMGFDLEVQVLPRVDDRDRSEAQLREGDRAWGGSVERNGESTNRKRI